MDIFLMNVCIVMTFQVGTKCVYSQGLQALSMFPECGDPNHSNVHVASNFGIVACGKSSQVPT